MLDSYQSVSNRNIAILSGLVGSVITVNASKCSKGDIIVAADGFGKTMVWVRSHLKSRNFYPVGSMNLNPAQMPREILTSPLLSDSGTENSVLIILGCLDSRIRVKMASYQDIFDKDTIDDVIDDKKFEDITTLNGHEDWITCLCVKTLETKEILIA